MGGREDAQLNAAKRAYRHAAAEGNRQEEARWANVIGDILKNRGEYVKALKWLRIDYEVSVKYLPEKQLLPTCQSLGEVYLRLQHFQDALIYQVLLCFFFLGILGSCPWCTFLVDIALYYLCHSICLSLGICARISLNFIVYHKSILSQVTRYLFQLTRYLSGSTSVSAYTENIASLYLSLPQYMILCLGQFHSI